MCGPSETTTTTMLLFSSLSSLGASELYWRSDDNNNNSLAESTRLAEVWVAESSSNEAENLGHTSIGTKGLHSSSLKGGGLSSAAAVNENVSRMEAYRERGQLSW